MSKEATKETFFQEQKPARWKQQKRSPRVVVGVDSKPSSSSSSAGKNSSRRPILRPLPNGRASNTPQSTRPPAGRTVLSKSTPFSHQSSTSRSQRSRSSSFMQPTASSSLKSCHNLAGLRLPRHSTGEDGGLFLQRKRNSALSRPPSRAKESQSVSTSFLQLSDTPPEHCSPDDKNIDTSVNISVIHLHSPRLPATSPITVFSPDETTGQSSRIDAEEERPGERTSPELQRHVRFSDAIGPEEKIVESSKGSGQQKNSVTGPSDCANNDDLPVLNAALHAFSNINLSFNLDFSSDEEYSPNHPPVYSSRERSRGLGPILPIPSLRNDPHASPEGEKLQPEKSSPLLTADVLESITENSSQTNAGGGIENDAVGEPYLHQDDSPIGTMEKSFPQTLVLDLGDDDEDDLPQVSNSRPWRRRSRLGPILPIPSLRDDLDSSPSTASTPKGIHDAQSAPSSTNSTAQSQGTHIPSVPESSGQSEASKTSNNPTKDTVEKNDGPIKTIPCTDFVPLIKANDRHLLTTVSEEIENKDAIGVLQEQLADALKENKRLTDRLARYHRSYEERVTPYRDLFEEWRKSKLQWKTTEATHQRLVEEVQTKFGQALQLSFQKCQDLQAQLNASQTRVKELEEASGLAPTTEGS